MSNYRLDRWVVMLGIASRKEAVLLIKKGLVSSEEHKNLKADTKLREGSTITVEGTDYTLNEFVYYMMDKPMGVLSASRDGKARTVIDLLPQEMNRPGLFPAGRLDKDTEGFVLITNDGQFSHRILSPKNKVPKTYLARLNQPFDYPLLEKEFQTGVDIGEKARTSPSQLTLIEEAEKPLVELVIYEGKFHQVKRMFLKYNLKVEHLKRTKIGGLSLDESLKTGESRRITDEELKQI